MSHERQFEREEREVRLSIAYDKLDEDKQRGRLGIPATLDEVIPAKPKRKESSQCQP